MTKRIFNFWAASIGFVLMVFALANSLVTLANGRYAVALLTSLAATFLALLCLAIPFFRGSLVWRITALVIASPAIFIFDDFLRRMPSAF
jgi:hypothetical protein